MGDHFLPDDDIAVCGDKEVFCSEDCRISSLKDKLLAIEQEAGSIFRQLEAIQSSEKKMKEKTNSLEIILHNLPKCQVKKQNEDCDQFATCLSPSGIFRCETHASWKPDGQVHADDPLPYREALLAHQKY
jgi:hypothetical protein